LADSVDFELRDDNDATKRLLFFSLDSSLPPRAEPPAAAAPRVLTDSGEGVPGDGPATVSRRQAVLESAFASLQSSVAAENGERWPDKGGPPRSSAPRPRRSSSSSQPAVPASGVEVELGARVQARRRRRARARDWMPRAIQTGLTQTAGAAG
jgi:hypothetical protein